MNPPSELMYTSENDAAPDLKSLLEYLCREDSDRYLYRGQTQLWPGPLFPSAFRHYQRSGNIYTRVSQEYGDSLRKVGNTFVGLIPINFFHETLSLFYPSFISISEEEMVLLERLSNDQFLARAFINNPNALETMLTDFELILFRDRFDYWKKVIDYDHRVQIRDMVFMRPFGYLLGQALAQQYGFSSETLDVTSDPLVAAFFATHNAPDFCTAVQEGIGVIYRFLRPSSASLIPDLGSYNFYSCPAILDFEELLKPFCVTEYSKGLRSEIENFLVASFCEKKQWRRWETFRIASTILATTRVSRQSAAFLVPDEIYVERDSQEKHIGKIRTLMAVEDCATREGTALFFFHHSGDISVLSQIGREYLWPNEDDVFFEMIGNILLKSIVLDTGQILPSRIDLLSTGYRI